MCVLRFEKSRVMNLLLKEPYPVGVGQVPGTNSRGHIKSKS